MSTRMIFQLTPNHEQLVLEDERVIIMAKRTLLEKILIVLSVIAVTCCVILIGIILTSYYNVSRKGNFPFNSDHENWDSFIANNEERHNICNTEACVLSASDIISAMDESYDPCEDFFMFACGKWIKGHAIPGDDSSYSQFSLLRDVIETALHSIVQEQSQSQDPDPISQAKTFYKGCLNETHLDEVGLKPLTDYLDQFGGWPLTTRWIRQKFNWQVLTAKSRTTLDKGYLIKMFVTADQKDTNINALYIDQGTLSLPRSVLVNSEQYEDRIRAFKTLMKTIAHIIAAYHGKQLQEENLSREVEEVLNFEIKLANITTRNEERRSINRMYNKMAIDELQNLTTNSFIKWKQFLREVFSSTNITITGDTKVIVQELEYLKRLSKLIKDTDERVLSNYMIWRLIIALGEETTDEMRKAFFKYSKASFGLTLQRPRKDDCIGKTNDFLGMAVGQRYIENFFSNDAKMATNEMVENIRSSFEDLLRNNSWMEPELIPLAIEKAHSISKLIGYPDWYKKSGELAKFYAQLTTMSEKNHFENFITLSAYRSNEELKEFGKPTDRQKWYSPPTYANAFYWPSYNSIVFLGGILQPPFFRSNTLKSINYGAIGQVIGHEITHGFDDEGRQYDKLGNAIHWWSNKTVKTFEQHAKCVIEQYSNYQISEIDHLKENATINGVITQGENIADIGGLRQAFLAYQKYAKEHGEEPRLPGISKYTPEQLFFLSNANIWCSKSTPEGLLHQILTDPHSPSKYRVIGSMSNLQEFADTWKCKPGSAMNPTNKCTVW